MREGISDSSEQKSGNVNDNDCFGGAGDDVLCCLGGDHGCLYFEESGTLSTTLELQNRLINHATSHSTDWQNLIVQ